MTGSGTVFGDVIVSATLLNRRSGEILDQAWEKCVTIMRNDQAFTDMASEVYSGYARAARREGPLAEVDALIHEWQESAWALRSADVKTAFDAPADEVPITEPAGYAGR